MPFRDALFRGLAEDGGLYVPEKIPQLAEAFLADLASHDLTAFGTAMLSPFIDDVSAADLDAIVRDAWNFPIPLVELEPGLHLLELFHGPTLAFKDVGARFMARILSHYLRSASRELSILVATSGDTGSAVASGFHGVPHIGVCVLYPSGRISPLQEQQIATLGGNVTAFEVEGSFDDCQTLVKQALGDETLRRKRELTTANSINVGRLLPQMAYYGWGVAQWRRIGESGGSRPSNTHSQEPLCVVPSGNFGNITAGIYARAMGIPIASCAAATNANDVVPAYFRTGSFHPRASIATLSNAMDVGNPSNLARIEAFFDGDLERLRAAVPVGSADDSETRAEIRRVYEGTGRIIDPHTAVGVAVARKLQAGARARPGQHPDRGSGHPDPGQDRSDSNQPLIVLSTAHPGKFPEVIEETLGIRIPVPEALAHALGRPKQSVKLPVNYERFRDLLLAGE